MLSEKPKFKKWVFLLAALGFVAFLLYLIFFTDFDQLATVIAGTDLSIYFFAVLYVIVGSAFDALAWLFTLDSLSVKTTFARIFSLSWVGHFVDTLIPGGLAGDAFKTYLLAKEKDVNGAKAVASIVIKDVIELLVVLGFLVAGIVVLLLNYTVNTIILTAVGITMVLIALPLVLAVYLGFNVDTAERLVKVIQRISSKFKRKKAGADDISEKLRRQIVEFHEGLVTVKKNPQRMLVPVLCQSLAWTFELLAFFLVFMAAGSFIGIDKVLIVNTIVSNLQGQGVALTGFAQIVSSEIYRILGITSGVAAAQSLLAGFATFWFKLVLSFVIFQFIVFERQFPVVANFRESSRRKRGNSPVERKTGQNAP